MLGIISVVRRRFLGRVRMMDLSGGSWGGKGERGNGGDGEGGERENGSDEEGGEEGDVGEEERGVIERGK